MRLAQVMLGKGFGGAERAFVDLSCALARRGHRILAIGEARGRALPMLAGEPGVACVAVRCHGVWDWWCRRQVSRALSAFSPEVVQAHLGRAAAIAGAAGRALGVPTLAKTHTLVDLKYYRSIDLLVPTTVEQERYLRDHGVARTRLRRIPNFSALAPAAAARVLPRGERLVRTLGRFVPKKGFDVLLRAAALALEQGAELRLEIAGEGTEAPHLRALADELGIAPRVRFPGWIDDVAAYLAGADLFVLPSREEPFGIVVLEAMASGAPIVASRVGGPREILDETTAWLVPPDDPCALAAAIASALARPEETHERAARALGVFAEQYAEAVVVERYLEAYAMLRGGRA